MLQTPKGGEKHTTKKQMHMALPLAGPLFYNLCARFLYWAGIRFFFQHASLLLKNIQREAFVRHGMPEKTFNAKLWHETCHGNERESSTFHLS